MTGPVEFLKAAHEKAEKRAKDLTEWMAGNELTVLLVNHVGAPFGGQSPFRNAGTGMDLAALAEPSGVTRRIAADRKTLDEYDKARAEYSADGGAWDHESEVGRARTAALETAVRLLAEGWGWTEEEQQ